MPAGGRCGVKAEQSNAVLAVCAVDAKRTTEGTAVPWRGDCTVAKNCPTAPCDICALSGVLASPRARALAPTSTIAGMRAIIAHLHALLPVSGVAPSAARPLILASLTREPSQLALQQSSIPHQLCEHGWAARSAPANTRGLASASLSHSVLAACTAGQRPSLGHNVLPWGPGSALAQVRRGPTNTATKAQLARCSPRITYKCLCPPSAHHRRIHCIPGRGQGATGSHRIAAKSAI